MSTTKPDKHVSGVDSKRVTRRKMKPRNSSNTRSAQSNFVTARQVFGGKFSPSPNPPDVTFQPWQRVTLVDPFSGLLTVTVDTLKTLLRCQLDPTKRGFNQADTGDKRFVPQFKIHTVQCWNLTGHLISMSVQDYTDSKSAISGEDQLAGLVDTGSPGLLPKVGFTMPASQRNHVVRDDDNESKVTIVAMQVGPHDQGLAYITLEYRFDGSTSLPTCDNLFSMLSKCYRQTASIKAYTQENSVTSKKLYSTAQDILRAMPSAYFPMSQPFASDVATTSGQTIQHLDVEPIAQDRTNELSDLQSLHSTPTPNQNQAVNENLLKILCDIQSRLSALELSNTSASIETLP